jgi:hypothetical protein
LKLGQHPKKEMADTGYCNGVRTFSDDEVLTSYQECKTMACQKERQFQLQKTTKY